MGLLEILKGEQPGIIRTLLNYENVGQFGEYATEFALTNHNLKGEFVVLKNLYLTAPNGNSSEIDLVMVHEKGIFVFESKNYSGWIFGNTEQLYWTQSLQNGYKNKFYNPIRQNKTHIQMLAEYLGKPVSAFTSYIVFSERCCLKHVPENTEKVVIVRRPEMLNRLRATLKNSPVIYSHEEIREMERKLNTLTNQSAERKERHVEAIKTKCLFCGSNLVLREGKDGQFWGCSAYPKCKFTRPVNYPCLKTRACNYLEVQPL